VTPAAPAFRLAADPTVRVVVANLGLACCSLEVDVAIQRGLLVPDEDGAGAAHCVLLVSGTVTDVLAPAVVRHYEALPGHVSVMSFGACASTGGPYWDAPTVTQGVDRLVPVSVYVPGCPPRPEALVAGLLALTAEVSA
jgi:NADH-quinone oxidoreductase subunit B